MAPSRRSMLTAVLLAAGVPALSGCQNFGSPFGSTPASVSKPAQVALPPSVPVEDVVGRWAFGAYHREQDRARTEATTRGQCTQPYVINRAAAPNTVMMYGHDNPQIQEMTLKGSTDGKTYVGPGPEPGGMDDREIVSANGQVMVLRWVDPEVAGRMGTGVFVRCGDGEARTAGSRKPAASPPSGR